MERGREGKRKRSGGGEQVHLRAKFIRVMLNVGGLVLNKHGVDRKVYLEIGWKEM